MNIGPTIRTLLVLACGAITLPAVFADEEKEREIPFSEVPKAVQRTIMAQAVANKAAIGETSKETEKGLVVYEAILKLKGGKKLEIEVAKGGELLKVEAAEKDDREDKDDDKKKDDDKDDKK